MSLYYFVKQRFRKWNCRRVALRAWSTFFFSMNWADIKFYSQYCRIFIAFQFHFINNALDECSSQKLGTIVRRGFLEKFDEHLTNYRCKFVFSCRISTFYMEIWYRLVRLVCRAHFVRWTRVWEWLHDKNVILLYHLWSSSNYWHTKCNERTIISETGSLLSNLPRIVNETKLILVDWWITLRVFKKSHSVMLLIYLYYYYVFRNYSTFRVSLRKHDNFWRIFN